MVGIPKTLEDALRDEFVVPFVGAGVSMNVKDRAGNPLYPSWGKLLAEAAGRLRADGKSHEASIVEGLLSKRNPDYYESARYAREGMGPGWYGYLREALDPQKDRIDPASLALARAIWKLPSRLIVTTNYDQVLRFALDGAADDLQPINVDATAQLAAMLRQKIERPTVWHLHGHIHEPQKMILTPDGYKELYPSEEGKSQYGAALQALRHLLAARTFLFIGFSLDDDWFGGQIEWVQQAFDDSIGPHYMLVRQRDLRETQRRLRNLRCLEFVTFEEFEGPLVKRVEELAAVKTAGKVASNVPVEVPQVTVRETLVAPPPAKAKAVDMAAVREGYRTAYQYQRALFDRLAELSDALEGIGFNFDRWDPALFNRHAKSTTQFFRRSYWAWDFLPAYCMQLIWRTPAGSNGEVKRVTVAVVADTGYKETSRAEPDPAEFAPIAASESELHLVMTRSSDPEGTQVSENVLDVDLNAVWTPEGFAEHVIDPVVAWFSSK
ncbi:SIR2 family protein [Polyangium sp. y55x31]|uniref:SIR2 family NAD-dependent protein deacylase n=1 Tax=Polyangium sp. y55x31 TaxID=3042688 RepID=UPI00248247D2|nr:SIR2 family protein [Polyangium sp. y55x31]MDI1479493.1 SIR2 family protein [Polyangium sp. y55x31]